MGRVVALAGHRLIAEPRLPEIVAARFAERRQVPQRPHPAAIPRSITTFLLVSRSLPGRGVRLAARDAQLRGGVGDGFSQAGAGDRAARAADVTRILASSGHDPAPVGRMDAS